MTPDYDPNLDPENPEVVDGWPDAGLRKEVRLFTDGLTGDSWLRRARRAPPGPPIVCWASPGFVDTPNRTKSAIGVSHGEEAAAATVLAGVQGGSDQGG